MIIDLILDRRANEKDIALGLTHYRTYPNPSCKKFGQIELNDGSILVPFAYMIDARYDDVENDITDKFLKQYLCEEIMNDTNNHNPKLVEKINEIWNNLDKRERFIKIINLLISRDYVECADKGVFDVELEADKYYEYLMHVADDLDLETIISFVR